MLRFLSRRRPSVVAINGRDVEANDRETLLQAALRAGVPFPNSCRVGGCGTCKCRLVRGEVRELTESGYILTDEECRQGYILACQSVARTDLALEVEMPPHSSAHRMGGTIVSQDRLARDICRVRVQLDEGIYYAAGQFAELCLDVMPDVTRPYSFSTPMQADGVVSFTVRQVPGGQLSECLCNDEFIGRQVSVIGPNGNFWLRPGTAPLLMVAGGSGLAPILAMLKQAAIAGADRPATLLFGAREQCDLYALDEIAEIQRQWQAPFRFIPVLSEEPASSSWQGERGRVTERIPEVVQPGAHAYLCGPPGMIDHAVPLLEGQGIPPAHIHADRFLARHERQGDAAAFRENVATGEPVTSGNPAGMLHYLKFFLFHGSSLAALVAILAGGPAITFALWGMTAFYVVGDAICGDDLSTPRFRHPGILTVQLWLALPLLLIISFAAVWHVSPGDPFGFGQWVAGLTGYDVIAARDATGFGDHVSLVFYMGLVIGMVGTITGHELTHRTWDPVSMLIGRWLLAFSFDTVFAIEHVHGHHRYVATENDPATAPRGRNVYHHILASTIKGNVSAWRIEARRLARKGFPVLGWRNAVLRGYLMSVALLSAAAWIGGWKAAGFFILCGLWGKSLLEIVNYMEHYGLVRHPDTPVAVRHSWNTNKRLSSWSMFNLTRHSHHHAQGEVPYQDLRPCREAPMMIGGYLTTIIIALVPPLWHRLMTPRVLAWDHEHANGIERDLAARANARSGIPAMIASRAAG
ncbi:fatty acid desaturase [Noviherbaspirillum galbum]|uniref:2Fe-2S iron-sulfur cluster binding domain-containing protein n=1 Tax=Noviherbaspirillum galbum TaxID=2709383 RepID=A0A6B3SFC2_9BURK|nr:fatty acid desaturase [Noviherbaspirillum galbum]NEX59597.1 2Fe-2S iron-sulfur cluster binding domain-containing protein [Noviherbaspirillum galbum]